MAIATLTVDLVAKLANFEGDLGRVGQIAQKQADQMEKAFSSVKNTLRTLGVGITVDNIISAFKETALALDKLNDAADTTGASIESLSKLEDVARRNGAGIGLVETAILKMNKALSASDEEGKGASRVLEAIGLNVKELKKLDPAEALQKVAVAFNSFERNGDLARAAQILFGKSIAEVAPFLKDLAESGKLNASVTKEQAEQAEKFNKQMYGLKTNIQDSARSIVGDMLPAMTRLVSLLKEAGAIGSLSAALAKAGSSGAPIGGVIKTAQEELEALKKSKTEAGSPSGGGIVGLYTDAQIAEYEGRIKGLKELQRQEALAGAELLGDTSGERRFDRRKTLSLPPSGGGGAVKNAKAQREDLDYLDNARRMAADLEKELAALKKREEELAAPIGNILQRLRDQAQGFRETSATAGMTEAEIARMTAANIEEAAVLAELNGAYQSQIDSLNAVAAGYRDVAEAADEKAIADALQGTVTGKLEAQRKEMEFFADALDRGAISAEQFAEIATAKLGLVGEEAKQTKGIAEELGLTFASAFEDAIVNGSKFSDVLKAIEKDLIRIIVRKGITEPVGDTISGLLGGGTSATGSAGGLISNLTSLYNAGSKLYDLGASFFGAQASSTTAAVATQGVTTISGFAGASGAVGAAGSAAGTAGATTGLSTLPASVMPADVAFGSAANGAAIGEGATTVAVGEVAGGGTTAGLGSISATGWGAIIAAVVLIVMAALPKGGGPKFEGSFDNKNKERFFTKSDGDAQSKNVAATIAVGYEQLAKTLGGKADENIRLAFGFAVDPAGSAKNALHLAVGKQEFIRDEGRPEDLEGQISEVIQRGLLSALKQTDLYDSIDVLLAAFDPMTATSAEVAAEMTKITEAMNLLTQQAETYAKSLGTISDSMQEVHNMFQESVRNIRFGNADAAGKYSILDDEAARYRDMLKVLTEPALIGDYSKRLNDTINAAFALLSPEQQAEKADSFIARLNAADQLAQTQFQKAADAQKAIFAALPEDLRKAVEKGFEKFPAQIAAAIPKGLQVDFRANVPGTTEVAMIG